MASSDFRFLKPGEKINARIGNVRGEVGISIRYPDYMFFLSDDAGRDDNSSYKENFETKYKYCNFVGYKTPEHHSNGNYGEIKNLVIDKLIDINILLTLMAHGKHKTAKAKTEPKEKHIH